MLVLTGEQKRGKTTILREVTEGLDVEGFLSLKDFEGPRMTGISLMLLPEKKIIPAATTSPGPACIVGRFYFYPGVFGMVEDHFIDGSGDVPFVFDEFGRLEMRGGGHFPLYEALLSTGRRMVVVVRKSLVREFVPVHGCGRIDGIVDLDVSGKDQSKRRISEYLEIY